MAADLYDALRDSHERQRSLCRSMTAGRAASSRRRAAFSDLAVELDAHAAAEERYLYVPMMMLDAGLSVSRHALSEHHEIEELVDELRPLDPDGEAFRSAAKELSHLVHHHLREEEHGFFQLSGRLLSRPQKRDLRVQYLQDYARLRSTPPT